MKKSVAMKSDDEARAILEEMRHRAGTLFRALDTDGDGVLSPQEIAAAPEVLRALDRDGDGRLTDADIGGPTYIPGAVRRSEIVKMLDEDCDLVIGGDDIDAASERILRLDADGDGRVTAADDIPPPGGIEAQLPMGSPSQALAFRKEMFSRSREITGTLPPQGREDVQPGYLLIQEMNDYRDFQVSDRMCLLDGHGRVAHEWHTANHTPEATVAYLLEDGHLLRTTCRHSFLDVIGEFPVGAHGNVSIEDRDSRILWQWERYEPGREALHHDVERMPNGNILVIAWHCLKASAAQALGWRRQGARGRVFLDKIYEIRPDMETGGTEVVWEWAAADHLVQNVDPDLPNYGDPAGHPEKIDVNYPQLDAIQFNRNQLFHVNSVSYDAQADIVMISSAIFNEIWLIDHSTTAEEVRGSTGGRHGRGGDLIWRWGNPQTHGAGGPDDQILYWQHEPVFLSADVPHEGDVLVFNNGMRRGPDGRTEPDQVTMGVVTGAYSDILELKLPRDASGRIPMGAEARIVWSYNSDGRDAVYSPFMSGAQRLPDGNTLTVLANNKRIVEVTPDGERVLDFNLGGPGRMFRVYKYPPDHPGVKALGL